MRNWGSAGVSELAKVAEVVGARNMLRTYWEPRSRLFSDWQHHSAQSHSEGLQQSWWNTETFTYETADGRGFPIFENKEVQCCNSCVHSKQIWAHLVIRLLGCSINLAPLCFASVECYRAAARHSWELNPWAGGYVLFPTMGIASGTLELSASFCEPASEWRRVWISECGNSWTNPGVHAVGLATHPPHPSQQSQTANLCLCQVDRSGVGDLLDMRSGGEWKVLVES